MQYARVHPGESIDTVRQIVDEAVEAIDVVIVTAGDVIADRTFQRPLAEAELPNVHLAIVDRSDKFALHLQTRRGRKLLKQADYAIDEIFAPTKRPVPKLLDDWRNHIPAIFAARPFPFRLSCAIDVERSWSVKDHGALSFTRDGRLLHLTSSTPAARQIGEGLPEGDLLWGASPLYEGQASGSACCRRTSARTARGGRLSTGRSSSRRARRRRPWRS